MGRPPSHARARTRNAHTARGNERPFDEVKERIRVNLLNQRRQDETQRRLDDLRAKANVKVDDDVLAATEVPGAAPTSVPAASGAAPASVPPVSGAPPASAPAASGAGPTPAAAGTRPDRPAPARARPA